MIINYEQLSNLNFKRLSRQELGTVLNFEPAVSHLEKITKDLLGLRDYDNNLTVVEKVPVIDVFNRLISHANEIHSFDVNPSESLDTTKARRQAIIDSIFETRKNLNSNVLPILNYLKLENPKFQEILGLNVSDKQIKEVLQNTQNKILQIDNTFNTKIKGYDSDFEIKLTDFKKKIVQADSFLKETIKIRDDANNFTVEKLTEKYGDIFKKQADKNKNLAMISLGIFVLFLFALIILTYFLFSPILKDILNIGNASIQLEYVVVQLVFRLTLLGFGLIFVKESLKSFNINMHLYNLNLHRQNSLESFNTLIANTSQGQIRDSIIKEISQTIYSNQDSGYLSTDKKSMSLAEIAELIKAVK